MSDIIITKENISRFNKRLQKALSTQLSTDIKLTQAAEIMAQVFGVESAFELRRTLDKTPTLVKQETLDSAQSLINDIQNYFSQPQLKTDIHSFSLMKDNEYLSLNIRARDDTDTEGASFGLYFSDDPNPYVERELKHLKINHQDAQFIRNLTQKHFSSSIEDNEYLGAKLVKIVNLKKPEGYGRYHYSYTFYEASRPKDVEIVNHAYCKQLFLVTQEKQTGTMCKMNKWFEIKKHDSSIFNSFDEALKHANHNTIIYEYLTPIDTDSKKSALSSFYYTHKDSLLHGLADGILSVKYKNKNDLIRLDGHLANHQFKRPFYDNPYSINQEEFKLWLDGYHCQDNLNKRQSLRLG